MLPRSDRIRTRRLTLFWLRSSVRERFPTGNESRIKPIERAYAADLTVLQTGSTVVDGDPVGTSAPSTLPERVLLT